MLGALLGLAGRLRPSLDPLAHLAFAYAAVALVTVVAMGGLRGPWRPALLGAALVTGVASGLLLAPEFQRDAGPVAPASAPGQLKVIQLNALRTNADIDRVADWLIAERPDVVTLTEARQGLVRLLRRRTGWSVAGAHGDLVILTHTPYRRMDRPRPRTGAALNFVNATYDTPGGAAELMTAHLVWPVDPVIEGQRQDLTDIVGRLPRERMILAGDFNATPWSRELRDLDRELGLIRRDRAVSTFPAQLFGRPWPLPFLPIDHVYAGPGWATVSVKRGPWVGSDHYPLIVTLAPAARQ